MNQKQALNLTIKEFEDYINSTVSDVKLQSEEASYVRDEMITNAAKLFSKEGDSSIEVRDTKTDGTEVDFIFNSFVITAKVSVTKTGKTVKVSRLRKKDVKKAGKFKVSELNWGFSMPTFKEDTSGEYKIMIDEGWITSVASINLVHRKEKLKDIFTNEILMLETSLQDEDWKDIKRKFALHAAQPVLKKLFFTKDPKDIDFEATLVGVYTYNTALIDKCIEKAFTVKL